MPDVTSNDAIHVTIGVMARAPVAGRCKTRLAKVLGFEGAAELYRAMLGDRLATVSALRVRRRVVLAAPEDDGVAALRAFAPSDWEVAPQRGDGLGARLANAFRDLLPEEGGDGLLCLVDSDSPTLPFDALLPKLFARHPHRTVVLGPCVDGGYYLIGMSALAPGVFEGIPWSTDAVASATRARCASLGLDVVELESWYDVDEPPDLERLDRELRERPWLAPRTAAFLRGPR